MAYILSFIGVLLIVTGARDTWRQFGSTLYNDMIGSGGFIYWIVAIGIIGAIGYYHPLKTFSRAFIALIVIVFVLKNGGLFSQLQQALAQGPEQIASAAPPLPQDIPLHLSGLGGTPIPIQVTGGAGLTTLQGGQKGITALFGQAASSGAGILGGMIPGL